MATVVLSYAGAALGTLLGGPLGGVIGRAVGGLAGAEIDQALFGGTHREGPRINSLQVMASQEGAAIPVVFGRMRIAGQVIWATNILEASSTAGGKGLGGGNTSTTYSYFANFAVALCEGPIQGIGRAWADGKEIDLSAYAPRIYLGDEVQQPDSLITAVEGTAPAYRGLAYLVFERLPLTKFGNRLPQLSFEVFTTGNDVAQQLRAVNIIPGATEFGYDTALVTRSGGVGVTYSENTHVSASRSDWSVSLDQLQQSCSNVGYASLVVAWFGNDLNCGQCQIMPGTDDVAKQVKGAAWTVSGVARNAARAISKVNGAVAYGGTPSDVSVLHAIADLKQRGLKVMFNPFLLMDIAGSYPWRGRISGDDKTAAAATQIATFMGAAVPTQFAPGADTINFSGSEWSYRRMILHYAKLCALAGGVDAFLIGSELRGLSTLRSASGGYPFVTALVQLAADVKAILPSAKISYAADWTEYFGHQPQDGTGDVYFHLDPLWASTNIDFIGVDNYFPTSDWRDGYAHLDAVSGARSIYDAAYLSSRFASGEGFDWFYATPAARDAQMRSLIADGAYNKPWVFRPKDLKSWWLNQHFNRPAGVQATTATLWVPQSKPIWFTEIGCPAIEKGTNAPNTFYDAKSSESALPPYSDGRQDDAMQLAFVKAATDYWSAAGATNPISSVYGTSMVDSAKLFWWCWDARPYPAFPARGDVWSDSANHARGHWLNGRIGGVALGSLIAALASRFGFLDVDVSGVIGMVDGFVIDRPMSARDALQQVLAAFSIDAVEQGGKLKFTSRSTSQRQVVDLNALIDDAKASPLILQMRAQETDLPAAVKVTYFESGLDYRQASVSQRRSGTSSKAELSLGISVGMTQAQAQARADAVLAEAWAGRETAHFSLLPSAATFVPGDVVSIAGNDWRIKNIKAGSARKIEAEAHDSAVYDPPPAPVRGLAATFPAIYGAPQALLMDLALWDANMSAAPRLAAQATPWPGSLAVYKRVGLSSFVFNSTITQQATIGLTQTVLVSGSTDRVDFNQTLDVKMTSGALSSVSRDELLAGANAAAIGDNASGFELIQFQNALLIAPNSYRLSGLLRAQAGSSVEMLNSRAAGANFILLNAAIDQPVMTLAEAAQGAEWRIGPSQLDYGSTSYLTITTGGSLKALRPLAPTYFKLRSAATGLNFSWIRRSRDSGDSWEVAEIPLGESAELYQLQILRNGSVVRTVTTATPNYFYANAEVASDFGAIPSSLLARVVQISSAFGPGAVTERTFNV